MLLCTNDHSVLLPRTSHETNYQKHIHREKPPSNQLHNEQKSFIIIAKEEFFLKKKKRKEKEILQENKIK